MIVEQSPSSTPETPGTEKTPPSPSRIINLDRLFLQRRGELSWDQMTNFRGGPRRHGHKLILWSFMAVLIDALILLSMSCFFLLVFALIVRSPVGEVLRAGGRVFTPKSFVAVFVMSAWLYMVSLRVFFGFSVGEWACDLRLGQPTQRLRKSYPAKVILRASVIVVTGLVSLPLLSILLGRDLAGRLSGVKLMSLR